MKYDFDTVVNRRGTNSLKYDFGAARGMPENLLPMWVADMDFPAPPEVIADLQKAVAHGVFGYSEAGKDYYDALISWFASRFNYTFSARDAVKTPGVVFALAAAVKAFTEIGDGVLIQTPVYHPFYDVIRVNRRKIVTNPLTYQNGEYAIDFADFERKITENCVRLFILCSPHNPVGRVWKRDELARMLAICQAHNVLILSDEIHCDFVWTGHSHTCFGLLADDVIIATAPSKTFNLAGLQAANVIIKNAEQRRKFTDEIHRSGYSQLNGLGLVAAQSAYLHGGEWLEQLRKYLEENIASVRKFVSANLPKVKVIETQGTYLVWLDFSVYDFTPDELDKKVIHGAKLWLSSGRGFGEDGAGFQRINIACQRAVLNEGLARLKGEFA